MMEENPSPTSLLLDPSPASLVATVFASGDEEVNEESRSSSVNSGTQHQPELANGGAKSVSTIGSLCRICLCDPRQPGSQVGRMLESLSKTTVESKSLYSMLMAVCSPLAQGSSDGMPDKICTICKVKLLQAYKLYETCIRSDDKIRRLLQLQFLGGGAQVKQEIMDEDEDDGELVNAGLYYDDRVKKELDYMDQDYLMDNHFYGGSLASVVQSTPNLKIHSVRNGAEAMMPFQDYGLPGDTPPKPTFQCEKFVKVTPKGHHCLLCGKDFKYFSYFKQHAIAQHDPSKPFSCEQCKYTFKTEQRLFIHMRAHLEESNAASAAGNEPSDMMEASMEQELDATDDLAEEDCTDLKVTINPDTGDKLYNCLICQKQLTTLPLFKRHQTVHTVRGRPFECGICHYRFAMKYSYNAHMALHEKGIDPAQPISFKCPECDEAFPKRRLLNSHITTEHNRSPSPATPLNKTAPAAILTSNISDGRHSHVCPICSETFNRESVLNNHMKTHELEAAQLKHSEICYVCTVCGLECETREIFTNHIETHGDIQLPQKNVTSGDGIELSDDEQQPQNGEDPLSLTPNKSASAPEGLVKIGARCDLCNKTFPYACNLKQHKIIHHSEMKPHECAICHYRFEYEGTLLRHMQKHSKSDAANPGTSNVPNASVSTEEAIVAPNGASIVYKCKLCSARFQKQKSMAWHLKTHRSIVANSELKEGEPNLHSPPLPKQHLNASQTDDESKLSMMSSTPTVSHAASAFAAHLNLKPQGGAPSMDAVPRKTFQCTFCPQKLYSEEAYYQHMLGHRKRPLADPLQLNSDNPVKKKRSWVRSGDHHQCPLCKKMFTFRSQLQQHTALHHQPGKPYECGKCHYSFVHKLNLKRHELTHLEEERLANEEEEDPIRLLEDEGFNTNMDEFVEPVLDELLPTVGLMPVNRNSTENKEGGEPSSSSGPSKRNKCVVCSTIFSREDQLIEHLKTHIEKIKNRGQESHSAKKNMNDESDRTCKLCSKVFKYSCQLKQHLQMHHAKEKPYECNICKYRFEFKGHMIRHKAINHADEVAAEEAESDEMPSKITTPVVNPDGSEVYQCPVCPLNFVKQRSLTWHLKTHTGRRTKAEQDDAGFASTSFEGVMQCSHCPRIFDDEFELKAHMMTHLDDDNSAEADHSLFGSGLDMMLQDFPDTIENHETDPLFDASNLELVLEDGAGNDDLDFNVSYQNNTPPPGASKRSNTTSNESSIFDIAEPGNSSMNNKGKIVCKLCKKDFLYACNLKQHVQLHHAKDKPFECKICFYRFEYSGHLVRHVRQNHENDETKSFVCTFCSELFEHKGQLNAHINTYHRGEKQFKCDYCPASFTYKKSYDTHREEHVTGKRPSDTIPMTSNEMKVEPQMTFPSINISAPVPVASTSSAATSFSCNFCKKTFSSAQKVDNHVCFQ
ncbi:zinc finger protein 62-like [Uranotaenia lowii]|uniref:zinc finger protein 62-like n=1 Tax=Uranotaenia lowii TaxID=190385 RepID=UPI00247A098B|nr:zinc finger protein 62-like [Uranotaenia lowii]